MRNKHGFTLVELLVVMAIIAILAGLLIPGVLRAIRQAKTNRTLSEMQHLATVISQVYSDVGYYVRLEDLAKSDTSQVRVWTSGDYVNGQSDDEITTALSATLTGNMWNGPYITYKTYVDIASGSRPIDPWGKPTGTDAEKACNQYRMFWTTNANLVPAGANGTMVIISPGPDSVPSDPPSYTRITYECGISSNPVNAKKAQFQNFNPISNDKGDDVYYIFNAGIQ